MKKFLVLLTFTGIVFLLSACHKEEDITGNTAPPDQTVENVTIRNYVNRVYVSVLGREASESEKDAGFSTLRNNNLSMASRIQFLDQVFSGSEYKPHLYDFARVELLNNLDTAEITQWLFIFNQVLND